MTPTEQACRRATLRGQDIEFSPKEIHTDIRDCLGFDHRLGNRLGVFSRDEGVDDNRCCRDQ